MEEPQTTLLPKPPERAAPPPIRDITASPPTELTTAADGPKEEPGAPPPMPDPADGPKPVDSKPEPAAHKTGKLTKPTGPRPPAKTGVGAAIFATVVIVLGLAALAVYAYIKTK